MSGFEVIGLVLGLYPIVLDAYKKSKGEGIEKAIRRLEIEKFLFDDFVTRLIGPDLQLEEGQLVRLKASKDPACWKENDLQARLEHRYGFSKTKHIISLINDLNKLLLAIEKDLPGAARSFEKQQSKFRFAIRNLRSNLSDEASSNKFTQLKDCRETLRAVLGEHTTPSSTGPFRQPLPTVDFPQRDNTDAKHIYSAICSGYHCDCSLPHYANIEVPQLNTTPKLSWPRGRKDESRLHILFPIEDANTAGITDTLANVSLEPQHYAEPPPPYPKSALRLSRSDMSNFKMSSKNLKSASRKTRAISIRECADEKVDPILDLCNFVKTFNTPNTTPGSENELGILQSEQKKYKLQSPGTQNEGTRDTVSLDELTNPEKSSLPRGDRISLAVRLAYAIIQYYSTGWIDSEWTWKDFSVTGSEYKYTDVSQLFVSQKFYSASGKATKRPMWVGWESLGEPKLTRLGFALIELAMRKRLCEMRDATIDPNSDPDAQDYWTAIRLLNTGRIMREEGEGYANVVRACIEHQFRDPHYTMKYLDSRSETFHADVEQCVLKPLHCLWKEPFGQSHRQLCF